MFKLILITLSVAAAAASGTVLVQQNFEGAQFPPAGWEKEEFRGVWTRENVGQPYNWVAYFQTYAVGGGSGTLRTTGTPTGSGQFSITFDYYHRAGTGTGVTVAEVFVQRQQGSSWISVENRQLPKTTSFVNYNFRYTVSQAGVYRVCWRAEASEKAIVFFKFDNVVWESAPFTGAQPTSWGRVRAMYK